MGLEEEGLGFVTDGFGAAGFGDEVVLGFSTEDEGGLVDKGDLWAVLVNLSPSLLGRALFITIFL